MHWIDLALKGISVLGYCKLVRDHAVPVIAGISVTLSIISWQIDDLVSKI